MVGQRERLVAVLGVAGVLVPRPPPLTAVRTGPGAARLEVGVDVGVHREQEVAQPAHRAIVLGLQARSRLAGQKGARMATVAVAIATLAVLSVVFFMIAGAPD